MKRWWLPSQKGTELWPRTTVSPPKLVIEGSQPGSARARAIAELFGGRIKAFHGKCQQDYSLTNNPIMQRHTKWDGARATYANLHGQEIIHVEVDQSAQDEIKKKIRPLPNWAVVKFTFPNHEDFNSAQIYARLRGTEFDTFQIATGLGSGEFYKQFRLLSFAGMAPDKDSHDLPLIEPNPDLVEMELLIDLRPFHTPDDIRAGAVIVDVYALAAQVGPEEITGYRTVPENPERFETIVSWYTPIFFGSYTTIRDGYISQWTSAGLPLEYQVLRDRLGQVLDDFAPYAGNQIPDFIGVDQAPVDPPTLTVEPPLVLRNDPSPPPVSGAYRNYIWHTDPATGLIIGYGMTSLAWNDDTASIGINIDLTEWFYDVVTNTGRPIIGDPGPGAIYGLTFFDDPRWVYREWDFPSGGFRNFRWLPSTEPGPEWVNLPVMERSILWPDLGRDIGAEDKDSPNIFLGTIMCDLETNSLSFQPA